MVHALQEGEGAVILIFMMISILMIISHTDFYFIIFLKGMLHYSSIMQKKVLYWPYHTTFIFLHYVSVVFCQTTTDFQYKLCQALFLSQDLLYTASLSQRTMKNLNKQTLNSSPVIF